MKPQTAYVNAYKATDLIDLLDHIAWTDTVRPALQREHAQLTRALVESTLGLPIQAKTVAGPVQITREQIAGKIYGMDFIINLMEKILAGGEIAKAQLKEMGVNL